MAQAALPPDHLALVIEDALAALQPGPTGEAAVVGQPDRRAALLYGWASGAVSARQVARRAETDAGLRYLLGGRPWSFQDVRAFRDEERASLEPLFADVLRLCRTAGMTRLGHIGLDEPSAPAAEDRPPPPAYARLATALFSRSSAADEQEERELSGSVRAVELPPAMTGRSQRQAVLRQAAATLGLRGTIVEQTASGTAGADSPVPTSPARRGSAVLPYLRIVAVLGIVLAGLLAVRWVASATATPATGSGQFRGRGAATVPGNAPTGRVTATNPAAEASSELDLGPARDEAMRLGADALASDQVETARDFYFLAVQAAPDDAEAADRLRQVETALGVDQRRADWQDAVSDLEDLRAAAPESDTVLRAYVTALVGAGREALARRDDPHALALCDEAVRWLPARTDAQACLAQARPAASSTPTGGPAIAADGTAVSTGTPAPTRITAVGEPTPVLPGSDVSQELPPLPSLDEIMPIIQRIQEQLSRSGTSLVPHTPTPLDGEP